MLRACTPGKYRRAKERLSRAFLRPSQKFRLPLEAEFSDVIDAVLAPGKRVADDHEAGAPPARGRLSD